MFTVAAPHGLDSLLSPISVPVSTTLHLPSLSKHFPLLLLSFVTFQVIQWIAPFFLARLSPTHFGNANKRLKHRWVGHVVSTTHAIAIVPLAFSCLNIPALARDKAFGFHDSVGNLAAISCGYFLWDTLDCIVHFTDIGFVIHGLSCLLVFGLSFRPFLGYYGARFLLWELSTPFLNIHWYLDKTNRSGGYLQIANGAILLTTFFFARICYGGYMSLDFFYTLQSVRFEIPIAIAITYGVGNLALQALNWFWFYKMLCSVHNRFQSVPRSEDLNKNGGPHLTNGFNVKIKSG